MGKSRLERDNSYSSIKNIQEDIKNIYGEIASLGKAAEKNVYKISKQALAEKLSLEKQNAILIRDARLEALTRTKKAEEKSLHAIYKLRYNIEEQISRAYTEQLNRQQKAEAKALNALFSKRAENEELLTNIRAEQSHKEERNQEAINNKLYNLQLEHERKLTQQKSESYKKEEIAQAVAENKLDDLKLAKLNHYANALAEQVKQKEVAEAAVEEKIAGIHESIVKKQTQVLEAGLLQKERLEAEQAEKRLDKELELQKILHEQRLADLYDEEDAKKDAEILIEKARNANKEKANQNKAKKKAVSKLAGEYGTSKINDAKAQTIQSNIEAKGEKRKRKSIAKATSKANIANIDADSEKKQTAIETERINRVNGLRVIAKNKMLSLDEENEKKITSYEIARINAIEIAEKQTTGLITDLKTQSIIAKAETEAENINRLQLAEQQSINKIEVTKRNTAKKQTEIETERLNRANGLQELSQEKLTEISTENEKKLTALALANINSIEVAQKQAEGRITDLQIQNLTLKAETEAENINRSELARQQSEARIRTTELEIAKNKTKLKEVRQDKYQKAALDHRKKYTEKELELETLLHEQRLHYIYNENDARLDGEIVVQNLINANNKVKDEMKARESAKPKIINAKSDALVTNKQAGIQTKSEDLLALIQANDTDEMLKATIDEMFLDLRTSVEQNSMKLITLRKLYADKETADRQNNLKHANELNELLIAAEEAANKALYEQDLDLTTKKGKHVAKRARDEVILEAADKKAQEYVSKLPLIGKKLGERGNILDIFKDLSVTTDKWGKTWTKSKAKAGIEDAYKASGKSSKKEFNKDYRERISGKIEIAAQNGELENYKKLEKQIAEAKEAGKNTTALEAKKQQSLKNMDLSEEDVKQAEARDAKKGAQYAALANATKALANIAQKLDGLMDEIATYRGTIDTRLNGLTTLSKKSGSYYNQISFDFSSLMTSPLIKQKDLLDNLIKVVDKGIARDVEQMAMLETIHGKIATTFNIFDGTMLRLIRIQDYNTTAARLGMEASLNAMLNEMYQTTEYLSDLASSVRSNLEEAQALMSGQEGVAFEYQVQKWLGSLYSVGMSNSGVTAISSALGKLAAGDLEGITQGGVGNLLVMAANNSNMSLANILANGLDASETNVLLNNVVGYMNTLVDEANGNKVVQQQLAKVFGLTASDLRAVKNIVQKDFYSSVSMKKLYSMSASSSAIDIYNSMLGTLYSQAGEMANRVSLGEKLQNIMANVEYSTAAGEVNFPVLYMINKTADILNSFAGGIPIPAITAFGTGVDTKLTVADIMKTAAMVGGFTNSMISMIGSLASGKGAGWSGSSLLKMVGVEQKAGRDTRTSSSGSGSVVNASVSDMTGSATSEGNDSAKQQSVSAKEESTEVNNETINNNIVNIYELLKGVVDGTSVFNVKVNDTPPISVANNNNNWVWPVTNT